MTNETEDGRPMTAPVVIDRRTVHDMEFRPGRRPVAILDDDPVRVLEAMAAFPSRTYHWAETADEMIRLLDKGGPFEQIMLDHDLVPEHYAAFGESRAVAEGAPPTGMRTAEWLAANASRFERIPIHVHSLNEEGGMAMARVMRRAGLRAYYTPWGWSRV
jgi:hypothetical protein